LTGDVRAAGIGRAGVAEGLPAAVRGLGAAAGDPECDPAVSDEVQRRGLLGEVQRVLVREPRFMTLAPERPPTAARELSRRARHRPAHGRGGLPCLLRRSSVTPSPARGSVALPATTTAISSAGGTTPRTATRSRRPSCTVTRPTTKNSG